MEPQDAAIQVAYGAVVGIVYAAYGILTKRESGEAISPQKAARTTVLFAAAGVLVSLRGGAVTEANVEQHTTEVAIVGVLFDHAWAALRSRGALPFSGNSEE